MDSGAFQQSKDMPLLPVPEAFLLCDQVVSDEFTKKKTLVGVFDRIWVSGFPTKHFPVVFYARLYDGQGEYNFRVDYVRANSHQVLGSASGKIAVANRYTGIEFSLAFPPIPIPEEGDYEFQLWINDHYIHRTKFKALKRPNTGG
jgi:hypothetical protein